MNLFVLKKKQVGKKPVELFLYQPVFFLLPFLLLSISSAKAFELTGNIATEGRSFFQAPTASKQKEDSVALSLSFQPEFYHEWEKGYQSVTFTPFLRLDQIDPERTHFDVRELFWQKAFRDWELRLGIRKVYWGVIESVHLVDIINQTDLAENLDGEDKIGQPMINFALIRNWGILDLFILPGFRERTFPGPKGRLRSIPYVDTDQAQYESHAKERRVDFAMRWSHTLGFWDLGLAYFSGTSRDPRFLLGQDTAGNPALLPFYDIINQTSADIQTTVGGWLFKGELISRGGQGNRYTSFAAGYEYTFGTVFNTNTDIGVLTEYIYDDRGNKSSSPFEEDIFLGTRIALNDEQSTEVLAGIVFDLDTSTKLINVEASRRIGKNWKLNVEYRGFSQIDANDPFNSFRKDSYFQSEFFIYF